VQFRGNLLQTQAIAWDGWTIVNRRDQAPLVQHNDPASVGGLSSANGRFDSGASTGAWFNPGGTLAAWKALVRDTTSVAFQPNFPDPNRDIASYHASIGGAASLASFMTEARKQSKQNWRVEYTAKAVHNYIRAGFGLTPF
jgi:hypothetical protein